MAGNSGISFASPRKFCKSKRNRFSLSCATSYKKTSPTFVLTGSKPNVKRFFSSFEVMGVFPSVDRKS